MNINRGETDFLGDNHIFVSCDSEQNAVQKTIALLVEKDAFYPLNPTFYSSGKEGFVLDGFDDDELESISAGVSKRLEERRGQEGVK